MADVAGTYIVDLMVEDNNGATSMTMSLSYNRRRTAANCQCWCGYRSYGTKTVNLDGSSSFDPTGRDLIYTWTLSSAPTTVA